MGEDLNPAFRAALREMGRRVTLEDLKRRGVKQLRSLGMAEVSLLIERAVNRTLIERTSGIEPVEAAQLAERAKIEFSQQLAGLHELADSRLAVELHRREVREQLRQLRHDLGLRRGFVAGEEGAETAVREELSTAERLRLQACLLPFLEGASRPPGPAIEQVLQNLAQVMRGELESSLRLQRQELERQMELLERRIEKLNQSLADGEAALQRLSTAEATDPGVASRQLQGLKEQASEREKKRALMSALFEANLELQRKD